MEARPHNLPAQLTDFVGRGREMEETAEALQRSHLVTLVGLGGIDKTRLAIAVAGQVLPQSEDGVVFVDLAEVTEAGALVAAVAAAVGVSDQGTSLGAALDAYLSARRILLVLDNLEQLQGGGRWLAELLKASPNLRVLATSRVLLRIRGEHVYELSPLGLARAGDEFGSESLELFLLRARVADSSFELSDENLRAAEEIVRLWEGWPLAIELAAARLRVLLPQVLASRLASGLGDLGSGAADLPQRHHQRDYRVELSTVGSHGAGDAQPFGDIRRGVFLAGATSQVLTR